MKFLILQKVKQAPLEVWAKMLPAHFKYLDELEKKGMIEVSYHLIGHQGDVFIANVKDDEELAEIVGEDPLLFLSERQIYPLTTREAHRKRLEKIFSRK